MVWWGWLIVAVVIVLALLALAVQVQRHRRKGRIIGTGERAGRARHRRSGPTS